MYLDAPERAAFEAGMGVITREKVVDDLAAFVERYAVPMRLDEDERGTER